MEVVGIDRITPLDVAAARELDMVIRLVGAARLLDGKVDVRVSPALVDRHHPLAAVEGAFNAVMLQGDAIREITLEGPGAGGVETASAVIADMASVIGTMGTGFLQNDPVWRVLPRLAHGENRSPFYFHLSVDDRPGVLARVTTALAERDVSVARLLQHANGDGAALHVVTHDTRQGPLDEALAAIAAMGEVRRSPLPFPGRLRTRRRGARMGIGVIQRYRDRLPVGPDTPVISLGEGDTPLIPSPADRRAARHRPALQVRGDEPDRQFQGPRDGRGRLEGGRGGRAGRDLRLDRQYRLVGRRLCRARRPDGDRPLPGGRDRGRRRSPRRAPSAPGCSRSRAASTQALENCLEIADRGLYTLVNSVNPNRIEGQKTAVFEIVEQLGGRLPTCSRCPTAAAATRSPTRRGSTRSSARSRIVSAHAVNRATTMASAIRISEPAHLAEVEALVADGRVEPVPVSDDDITRLWRDLASYEGIFCEPSSAAGLAALEQSSSSREARSSACSPATASRTPPRSS